MTTLTKFAPSARRTVIRAGTLASEDGKGTLSDRFLLLALAESRAIEVARWASRRGHRTLIDREDLLWGLLADASSESVRILRRCGVDLSLLWAGLRRWHQSA